MNKLVHIINKIFSVLLRVVKWIQKHWSSLRKVLVVLLILGGLVYQFSLPDVRKKINKSAINVILQYEQDAISFKKNGRLSDAIDSYKKAIAMIKSQKELSYLNIDDNTQYRIYKDTAILILNYSKFNKLSDSQKDLLPILLNELSIYKNKMVHDLDLDKIISDIFLLQNNH